MYQRVFFSSTITLKCKVDFGVKLVSETGSTAIGIETLYVELDVGINMSAFYFKKGSLVTIPIKFRHNDTSLTRFI